jgi:hypothetical protein
MQFLGGSHEATQVMQIHRPSAPDYINFLYKCEAIADR